MSAAKSTRGRKPLPVHLKAVPIRISLTPDVLELLDGMGENRSATIAGLIRAAER